MQFGRRILGVTLSASLGLVSAGVVAGYATDSVSAVPRAAKASTVPYQIVGTRRLTESQYRHAIADVFGTDIAIAGRFEPERREHGLFAIGSTALSVTSSGFEQYFAMGRSITDQAFDAKRRDKLFGAAPAAADAPDDARAAEFIAHYGRILFRRPLEADEISSRVALARRGAEQAKSYDAGLKLALTSLLTSSNFLFREERAEKVGGKLRYTAHTKAQRLAFALWDSTPDEALLAAADRGELHMQSAIDREVDRLLASPKMEQGFRAMFTDMLQLDRFETLTKDAATYPKFSAALMTSAREQTLRFLVDHLLTRNGDYREIFTTPDTVIDRVLGSVYRIPYGGDDRWMPYTFPADADQAGILTQVTFLSLFSHPGRSSPTLRGVGLNEVFLCLETPAPPANVDFSIVNDTSNTRLKTTRARLLAHAEDETCAGCHNLTDPIGLSLERYDSLGQSRLTENGELIDVSADMDGVKFEGAKGLGAYMRDNPYVPECIVRNVYAYGVGRDPAEAEDIEYLQKQTAAFEAGGYKYRTLVRSIVSSPEYFKVVIPPAPEPVNNDARQASAEATLRLAGGLK